MSPAAVNESALSRPSRGAIRTLLPVVVAVAILSLMIVSGIQRNRARLAANTNRLRDSVAILERFQEAAADFLRKQQNADGSWSYHRGPSAGLEATPALPDLSSTERILLNVRSAGYEDEAFYAAGRRFVEERASEPMGPQSTFLGWLLLRPPGTPGSETLLREGDGATSALAEDLLLLGVLPPDGGSASELQASIRRRLNESPRSAAEWLALGYFARLASESGSPASRSLLPRFLDGFRSRAGQNPWDDLDSLALASYLALLGEDCRGRADTCPEGNEPLGALVGRRRMDGSWPAGALAEADGSYGGSAAETTSLALSALSRFRQIVEARAGSK